ncbi:ABC-type transport auxiliary lipoprotein family protein [Thiotrichales bacterium 19S9-12]|nr:ABC-type transport auxiliary lipoprotein family protein [Thiotrichales bacterium 19S9-11]MCF6812270.1 ABC-type transport auxiliary lipoprotein family protein [Thiotrichales bacterium 19S9-12]
MKIVYLLPRLTILSVTILLTLLISSCGSLLEPVKVAETKTYQITTTNQVTPENHSNKSVLRIDKMQSTPPYNNIYMYYATNQSQIKHYAYSHWVTAPSNMLDRMLLEDIDSANIYQATVATSYFGQADYKLSTTLLELNQHMNNQSNYVTLKVLAQLSNNQTNRLEKQLIFNINVASSPSPEGMATAANQAANTLVRQITEWLKSKK